MMTTPSPSLESAERVLADQAARRWWRWRKHYLAGLADEANAARLWADLSREERELFVHYLQSRTTGERMRDPNTEDLQAKGIASLIREADDGWFPSKDAGDVIRYRRIVPVPQGDPFAAQDVPTDRLAPFRGWADSHPLPFLAGLGMVGILIVGLLFGSKAATTAQTVAQPSPTPTVAAPPSIDLPSAQDVQQAVGIGVLPIIPTSIEVDEQVYQVQPTDTVTAAPPAGVAYWIDGTVIRPIFCVAQLPEVADGLPIFVRDTTSALRSFTPQYLVETAPHKTEFVTQREVGLVLMTCSDENTPRQLLLATYDNPYPDSQEE